MIFDNNYSEQNFTKPRLGTDNLFFKRSGDMTKFGKIGSTLAPLIGAAYGGQKGAQIASAAFGGLASLGMSKTAEQGLYDDSIARMERNAAIGQIAGMGTDFINDMGKKIGTAALTGGTSLMSGSKEGNKESQMQPAAMLPRGLFGMQNAGADNVQYSQGLTGFDTRTSPSGIQMSSQSSIQNTMEFDSLDYLKMGYDSSGYLRRAKDNPLLGALKFKDGGIVKSNEPMKKKGDNSEDIELVDKETGTKVGEMRYNERIFSQQDTKKMEKLASQNKLEELGKLVKSSLKKQDEVGFNRELGLIMAQDGAKPTWRGREFDSKTGTWTRADKNNRRKNSPKVPLSPVIQNRPFGLDMSATIDNRPPVPRALNIGDLYTSIGATLPSAIAVGQMGETTTSQSSGNTGVAAGARSQSNPRGTGGDIKSSSKTTPTSANRILPFADAFRLGNTEVVNNGEFARIQDSAPIMPIADIGSGATKNLQNRILNIQQQIRNNAPTTRTSTSTTTTQPSGTSPSILERLKGLQTDRANLNRIGGNVADAVTAASQAIRGSRMELPRFEPSAAYLDYGNRLGQLTQSGLPASQDASLRSQLDRQSAMTMGQLGNISGGSQGAALGVLSNMATGTQSAVAQRQVANDQAQRQAMGMYGNFLNSQRQQDFSQIFAPEYEQTAADITSTAQSVAALRGNIEARNNFYNTYEDPNSPYRRMIESQIGAIGRTEQSIEDEENTFLTTGGNSLVSAALGNDKDALAWQKQVAEQERQRATRFPTVRGNKTTRR